METANVGPNKKTVTTNMVVTYPGKDGIEISANGQIISIRDYIEKEGNVKVGALKNAEANFRAYLAKYDPEKLKEYEAKKAKSKKTTEETSR